jgi:hypothetical protein
MICPAIFWQVAFGMTFFVVSSVLCRYGRPAMILAARASPMPGSAINWSFVAALAPKHRTL